MCLSSWPDRHWRCIHTRVSGLYPTAAPASVRACHSSREGASRVARRRAHPFEEGRTEFSLVMLCVSNRICTGHQPARHQRVTHRRPWTTLACSPSSPRPAIIRFPVDSAPDQSMQNPSPVSGKAKDAQLSHRLPGEGAGGNKGARGSCTAASEGSNPHVALFIRERDRALVSRRRPSDERLTPARRTPPSELFSVAFAYFNCYLMNRI